MKSIATQVRPPFGDGLWRIKMERKLRQLAADVKFEVFYEFKCQYFIPNISPDYLQSVQFQKTILGFV